MVADFKTDRVEDAAAEGELVNTYRPQGAVYTAALQAALGLDQRPRFELWFLDSGHVLEA